MDDLPAYAALLLASGLFENGKMPPDTAAWLQVSR
jgi:hypothetical protein